ARCSKEQRERARSLRTVERPWSRRPAGSAALLPQSRSRLPSGRAGGHSARTARHLDRLASCSRSPVVSGPMGTGPLDQLGAAAAVALLREGAITSESLVRACLDRIARDEPGIRAWECLDPDRALARARALD